MEIIKEISTSIQTQMALLDGINGSNIYKSKYITEWQKYVMAQSNQLLKQQLELAKLINMFEQYKTEK